MHPRKRTDVSTIDWPGQSGKSYRYHFLDNITAYGILAVSGNYAFVKQLANGNFIPLYFGQAENLQERIPNHDRWEDAKRAGVTHVMAHSTQGGEAVRCAEEVDLMRQWQPLLNTQHRRVS
jgi:hypothetical protein